MFDISGGLKKLWNHLKIIHLRPPSASKYIYTTNETLMSGSRLGTLAPTTSKCCYNGALPNYVTTYVC